MFKQIYSFRILTLIALFLGIATTASAQTSYYYIPSASATDGRFLTIAGSGYNTLAGDTAYMTVISASSADSVEIGIFDGETGGYWDQGTTSLTYKLYTDSAAAYAGTTEIGSWSGSSMTDNGWYTMKARNTSAARTANGSYMYVLKIYSSNVSAVSLNAFKVRVKGLVTMTPNQAFNFQTPLSQVNEANVIYPSYPNFNGTRYDGSWDWYMDVPSSVSTLTIYDGDMDFGNYAADTLDTDDADSPSTPPTWATSVARNEGVASGDTTGGVARTGYPSDNSRYSIFSRGGAVSYRVYVPGGASFKNSNPSGNLEWEQFKLSTATYNASTMDAHADSLPKGLYRVHVDGMDLGSSNSWRFGYHTLGVDTAGTAMPTTLLDATGPSLTVSISSPGCWPPNNQIRNITTSLSAIDDRGGSVTIVLDTVISSEGGTSDISNVSYGSRDTTISLRCNQSSSTSNRVYTIRYKATDAAGNISYASATYTVSNIYNKDLYEQPTTTASESIKMSEVYPNPFVNQTTFSYDLRTASVVTVSVYTSNGEKVRTISQNFADAGNYSAEWDGRDDSGAKVAAGAYIIHVGAGDCNCGKTMQVIYNGN